jgi:hypothetical protein
MKTKIIGRLLFYTGAAMIGFVFFLAIYDDLSPGYLLLPSTIFFEDVHVGHKIPTIPGWIIMGCALVLIIIGYILNDLAK